MCETPVPQPDDSSRSNGVSLGKGAAAPHERPIVNPVCRKTLTHPTAEAQRRLAYFNERRDAIVSTIRELVEIESPSDNKGAVDRIAEAVAQKFSQLGGNVDVRVHPAKDRGNHLQVDFPGKSAAKPVLLLGH